MKSLENPRKKSYVHVPFQPHPDAMPYYPFSAKHNAVDRFGTRASVSCVRVMCQRCLPTLPANGNLPARWMLLQTPSPNLSDTFKVCLIEGRRDWGMNRPETKTV